MPSLGHPSPLDPLDISRLVLVRVHRDGRLRRLVTNFLLSANFLKLWTKDRISDMALPLFLLIPAMVLVLIWKQNHCTPRRLRMGLPTKRSLRTRINNPYILRIPIVNLATFYPQQQLPPRRTRPNSFS